MLTLWVNLFPSLLDSVLGCGAYFGQCDVGTHNGSRGLMRAFVGGLLCHLQALPLKNMPGIACWSRQEDERLLEHSKFPRIAQTSQQSTDAEE